MRSSLGRRSDRGLLAGLSVHVDPAIVSLRGTYSGYDFRLHRRLVHRLVHCARDNQRSVYRKMFVPLKASPVHHFQAGRRPMLRQSQILGHFQQKVRLSNSCAKLPKHTVVGSSIVLSEDTNEQVSVEMHGPTALWPPS